MATGMMNEREVILSCLPCDPRRVQTVLSDWGLDEATVKRMLAEHEALENKERTFRIVNSSINGRGSMVEGGSGSYRGQGAAL